MRALGSLFCMILSFLTHLSIRPLDSNGKGFWQRIPLSLDFFRNSDGLGINALTGTGNLAFTEHVIEPSSRLGLLNYLVAACIRLFHSLVCAETVA